jgi:hypothetical protein
MNKTTKIAAALLQLALALLAMLGGSGATAWMFLDDDGED